MKPIPILISRLEKEISEAKLELQDLELKYSFNQDLTVGKEIQSLRLKIKELESQLALLES